MTSLGFSPNVCSGVVTGSLLCRSLHQILAVLPWSVWIQWRALLVYIVQFSFHIGNGWLPVIIFCLHEHCICSIYSVYHLAVWYDSSCIHGPYNSVSTSYVMHGVWGLWAICLFCFICSLFYLNFLKIMNSSLISQNFSLCNSSYLRTCGHDTN